MRSQNKRGTTGIAPPASSFQWDEADDKHLRRYWRKFGPYCGRSIGKGLQSTLNRAKKLGLKNEARRNYQTTCGRNREDLPGHPFARREQLCLSLLNEWAISPRHPDWLLLIVERLRAKADE